MILDSETGALMSCLYAGSVRHYAAMVAAGRVAFDIDSPVGKCREVNRTRIIGANGVQTLTIPLVKPAKGGTTPVKDLLISEHGEWERVHWGAIFSAYGKAPFFEYYQDDLYALYHHHSKWLADFLLAIHASVSDFFAIPAALTAPDDRFVDLRAKGGENASNALPVADVPYYQVWNVRHGFVPGMSILDLVLNEGRCATLVLNAMCSRSPGR